MKKVNVLSVLGFSVLYVVVVFATAFLGFLNPFCWVGFPVLAALTGAYFYYGAAKRITTFGVGSLFGFLFGLLLLVSGEGDVSTLVISTAVGVVSDIIRKQTSHLDYSYAFLVLAPFSWLLPLWTRTEWYHDGAAEELGIDYADNLVLLANWWGLLFVLVVTALMGYLALRLLQNKFK
ncbi:MAG: Trep_Strep domain-containing protein [Prevotella sp.]|nr:Trep_Strep domain-containing protein [Prevotella sp.]